MFGRKHFTFGDIPDLSGKVTIVTGGNTGVGYITARELARKNAHVFVASRSKERGEASLKNVKQSAENFLARNLPLHILVNNAGMMNIPWTFTEDGIQDQFGVNHVGHFLFTKILLPKIEASAPSRIVNVSSNAHTRTDGIDFDKINQKDAQSSFQRYSASKLANILFSNALAKRLEDKQVYVNSIHPGFVATEFSRGAIEKYGIIAKIGISIINVFAKSPDDGALTQLYAATSPEIIEKNYRGKYFLKNYGNILKI
ncbi:hypothetical protein C1645_825971 [Glomus cerebriforme]|uniref:Uncharacterized protein n=1 Tax=Glomus cerebriforme TaxID=658196 RepID=A0A397SRC8_9GLOM|nr:hypothetical protein C1645_825971 [Glomus cerebriforme]